MSAPAPDPPARDDRQTRPAPLLPAAFADGRYRVTGQLGVGGMGVVLCARDELLDRDVAVKLLADNLSLDDGARTRFLREARAAAAVSDPRVVGVYDVGEEGGRPYLVMEYVAGPSLAEVLAADGPLPGDDVVDIATDALAGLGRAHDAGLLHRDVKPGNLLRAPDGTTKVTDFGVAIAVDGERMTRTGFVIGTAAYLAPERRRGEPATVRTDLWALGATLTELLTGQPPGEQADASKAALRGQVRPELLVLVRRLLANDPDDRPQDALEALGILAGDPAASHAVTPPRGLDLTRTAPITPPSRGRVTPTGWPPSEARRSDGAVAGGASRRGAPNADADAATALHPAEAGPSRRWRQLLLLAVVLVAAVAALAAVIDSGQEGTAPDDGFGPVVVDPADRAGTVRDLAEQLRDRAGS